MIDVCSHLMSNLSRRFRVTYLEPDAERFAREEVELSDSELEVSYMDKSYLPLHEMIREQILSVTADEVFMFGRL